MISDFSLHTKTSSYCPLSSPLLSRTCSMRAYRSEWRCLMSSYIQTVSFVIIPNIIVQRARDLFLCPRIPLQRRLLPTPAAQQASQLLGARRRPGLKQLWRPWIRRVYNPPLWSGRGLAQRHRCLLRCREVWSGRVEASRSSETGASIGDSN